MELLLGRAVMAGEAGAASSNLPLPESQSGGEESARPDDQILQGLTMSLTWLFKNRNPYKAKRVEHTFQFFSCRLN